MLYGAIHVGTGWKIRAMWQIKSRHLYNNWTLPSKTKQRKIQRLKQTKLSWFSRLLRQSARKWDGQTHTGPKIWCIQKF